MLKFLSVFFILWFALLAVAVGLGKYQPETGEIVIWLILLSMFNYFNYRDLVETQRTPRQGKGRY